MARLRGLARAWVSTPSFWRWSATLTPIVLMGLMVVGAPLALLMLVTLAATVPAVIDARLRPPGTPESTHETTENAESPPAPRLRERNAVIAALAGAAHQNPPRYCAAIALRVDQADTLRDDLGLAGLARLIDTLAIRLADSLRDQDTFCPLAQPGFGLALSPQASLDLGRVLSIIQRLQRVLSEPLDIDGRRLWISVSAGFCASPRAAALSQLDMLSAAERAACKAMRDGPGGINSFSVVDFPGALSGDRIATLRRALEAGQIRPYFQPQLSAATGAISGIEALARWNHPERGIVPPCDFLPAIEAAGLSPILARVMLRSALSTLADLDAMGLRVPTVSVNLSGEELRNPNLADEIAWELDRADLEPDRLALEILETVVANGEDDVAIRTIARLAGMGCGIDLDDFGTGHASLTSIRRFAVARLKIDRSFVSQLDRDDQQRRMVAAILSMAAQLGLSTLAEGVETPEEQLILAQMGCEHLQGFAIARPMPAEDLPAWIHAHDDALAQGEPVVEDPARPYPAAPYPASGATH